MQDDQFVRSFTGMIIGFVVLTILLIVLAIIVAGPVMSKVSDAKNLDRDRLTASRVAPVGQLQIGEPAKSAEEGQAAGQEVAAADGATVYETACAACHATGVAGAPALGDVGAWKDRIAQGMEMLSENAINGYQGTAGYMPPKGGSTALSDEEVIGAIEHMVNAAQ